MTMTIRQAFLLVVILTLGGSVSTEQAVAGGTYQTLRCSPDGSVWKTIKINTDFRPSNQDKLRSSGLCPERGYMMVALDRRIQVADLALVKALLSYGRAQKMYGFRLVLDSGGGDVDIAIAIGRTLFAHEGYPLTSVTVPQDGSCLSACVLILAGGRVRAIWGAVGIHRPFEPTVSELSESGDALAAKYSAVEGRIAHYLKAMGVSRQVVDLMMSTPSTRIRYLTNEERDDFGLSTLNVAAAELDREKRVRRCGLEFDQKLAAAEAAAVKCAPLFQSSVDDFSTCRAEVFESYGLDTHRKWMALKAPAKMPACLAPP